MPRRQQFPTAIQDIAINLVFAVMGESRMYRSQTEYAAIAARLPPLKVLTYRANEQLKRLHEDSALRGSRLPELLRFKAGDERWAYEEYPRQISAETIRTALVITGLGQAKRAKLL
jgi:hypothetical protein